MKIINIALSTLIVGCFVVCACDKQNVVDADAAVSQVDSDASVEASVNVAVPTADAASVSTLTDSGVQDVATDVVVKK